MSNITVTTENRKLILNINNFSCEIEDNIIILFDKKLNIIEKINKINYNDLDNILFFLENDIYIFCYYFNKLFLDKITKYCNIKIDKFKNDNGLLLLSKNNCIYNILLDIRSNENITLKYSINQNTLSSFKILCILDEFSYNCFKYECNFLLVDLKNIEQQILTFKPDIFFCESAWNSVYSNLSLCDSNNINQIRKIISLCKLNNIPTIFWNKEDDINYNRFIHNAKMFDIILTTDERCIPQYNNDTNNDNVYCLEFAAQPMIHNPLNNNKIKDIFFAGKWYHNMDNRKYSIETLIDIPILKNEMYKLDIYDRKYSNESKSFPIKYSKFLKKRLDYEKLCEITKHYKIMLNVNTITESNTMFSRRVYEGLSTGCIVLSTHSIGITKKFNKLVKIANTKKETEEYIMNLLGDTKEYNKLSHKCYSTIINTENYKNRLKKIIDIAGIEYYEESDDIVNIIIIVNKNNDINDILDFYNKNIKNQSYNCIIVTIFCSNKKKINVLKKNIEELNVKIIHYKTKQDVINKINNFKNLYMTVFDINDIYDNNFIKDTLLATLYIDKDTKMIGKRCYIDKKNIIHNSKYEHRYVEQLKRNSIIFTKNANQEVIDSIYNLDKFYSAECKKYSVELYNYIANI